MRHIGTIYKVYTGGIHGNKLKGPFFGGASLYPLTYPASQLNRKDVGFAVYCSPRLNTPP